MILSLHLGCQSGEESQPNIVWLTTEDNAPQYMELYNEKGVAMPSIEGLAKKGVVYHRAFSNAPVCSVARSTLITGCYAPRIFTQFHRKAQEVPLPEGIMPFPYYLRQAGYYTSNNSKQDYNFILPDGVWDASSKKASYKDRKPGQPFFHVQNFTVTHEGNLHFDQSAIYTIPDQDLEHIEVFPYHPDTKTFRYSYHHFHKRHQLADQQIGAFLSELEEQGLMENTIIFYFGDHGGVLPRSKGYAYESGLHVPLVVRIPENFQHLAKHERGSRTNGFVSFIDFGPTVLNLAGIPVPKVLDGTPFLGENICPNELAKRDTTFGYADRFDEKYDLVRTIRKGKYKYNRNYQGYYPDGLQNNYRYRMLAFEEWRQLYKQGNKLTDAQKQFFQTRPPEQLFDIENDPHEIHDLSKDPKHQKKLLELRGLLSKKVKTINDLSFYPENYMVNHALNDGINYGVKHTKEIAKLADISDLQLKDFSSAKIDLLKHLKSKNPNERHWALINCTSFQQADKDLIKEARRLLNDKDNMVA
ncbi:MAG: DUF229 domain-containing protein, partial [Flavobacteriia bacterium]|nr:DUF229 domain-containing protein [Flavobacteriia bacterium]